MNILVSYNWIREYLKTKASPKEFAEKMTLAGSSVERTYTGDEIYANIIIGVILKVEKHPKADRLSIVSTDIGGKATQIVCGGINLNEGARVVVALPGAKVFWHGEAEKIELQETEIRGEKSFGMICSPEEIGFGALSLGEKMIWDVSAITQAPAGTSIAKALNLDDTIFDIEVTTNRPDLMSVVGLSREGQAVGCGEFSWNVPKSVTFQDEIKKSNDTPIKITVKDKKKCRRYQAVVIDGIKVAPSPWWMQARLLASGHKPINNVVDVTNYVLHEYGQPLHAFDYDKLNKGQIIVRNAKKQEKILALDGREYELDASMLVIADAKSPVAIAGVMGGEVTGVKDETTRIVLECASFDPVSVRQTSRGLGLISDSSLVFEKGLSVEATPLALARAVDLIVQLSGGRVSSEVFDEKSEPYVPKRFAFNCAQSSQYIGVEIPEVEQLAILGNLGFGFEKDTKGYAVTIPFWRDNDIEASVDLIEEISRIYGYHNLPSRLPNTEISAVLNPPRFKWEKKTKQILSGAGAIEICGNSLVPLSDIERYKNLPVEALKVKNPLSGEMEYLRTTLMPSILNVIEMNQGISADAVLFELARVFHPNHNNLPSEFTRLALAVYGKDAEKVFLRAKGLMERFFREIGIGDWALARSASNERWHASRSASIMINGVEIGKIGQPSGAILKAFGIDKDVCVVDLDFDNLLTFFSSYKPYVQIPEFPEVKRDVAIVVDKFVEFGEILRVIRNAGNFVESAELFDVYVGDEIGEGKKSVALHIIFRAHDRTLDATEVDKEMAMLISALEKEFKAVIR